jgi:hypothetical protein
MKENNENSFSDYDSVKNIEVKDTNIGEIKNILENKENFTVKLTKSKICININDYSFFTINQMMQNAYPQENILFLYNGQQFYTPRVSLRLSHSSINGSRYSNSSFSSTIKDNNANNIKEEIINTDIQKPNIDNIINNNNIYNSNGNIIPDSNENNTNNINNSKEKINLDSNDNNNEEDKIFLLNLRNIQNSHNSGIANKKIDKNNRKFILYKWLFHFYLIVGMIILLHYITFIFSKYNEYFYRWVCIILIISLFYIGFIGIKNRLSNEKYFLLDGDNLFWTNFYILILTMINFIGLILAGGHFIFIKYQGIIGYLISFVYIITIIIEAIYVIYYDVIIEELTWEKVSNNNINDGFNKNNLNIQLMDVN